MVSRPGKQTIATFLCFSNGVKQKPPEEIDDMDPNKVDKEVIKAKLKRELGGIDTKYGEDFFGDDNENSRNERK